jgi:hypothetical protein
MQPVLWVRCSHNYPTQDEETWAQVSQKRACPALGRSLMHPMIFGNNNQQPLPAI